jgi:hypothetical protein
MCDRCPATALLETGSPDGWIPYYCEITHRRGALLEDAIGNHDTAARYRAHAERVKDGWTPDGAILPRATAMKVAASACSTGGGCAATGCTRAAAKQAPGESLLQIERPPAQTGIPTEVSR